MQDEGSGFREKAAARSGHRLRIFDLMLLIAGAALGLWLVARDLKESTSPTVERWLLAIIGMLGGISLLGPPLLLGELRRRRGRPWRAGKLLWFSQGMASWLLWPPIVYNRLEGRKFGDTMSGPCYDYGTPLMALYVTTALLVGGWMPTRRRRARPWREQFGLIIALAWACTGFYILYLLYKEDFRR